MGFRNATGRGGRVRRPERAAGAARRRACAARAPATPSRSASSTAAATSTSGSRCRSGIRLDEASITDAADEFSLQSDDRHGQPRPVAAAAAARHRRRQAHVPLLGRAASARASASRSHRSRTAGSRSTTTTGQSMGNEPADARRSSRRRQPAAATSTCCSRRRADRDGRASARCRRPTSLIRRVGGSGAHALDRARRPACPARTSSASTSPARSRSASTRSLFAGRRLARLGGAERRSRRHVHRRRRRASTLAAPFEGRDVLDVRVANADRDGGFLYVDVIFTPPPGTRPRLRSILDAGDEFTFSGSISAAAGAKFGGRPVPIELVTDAERAARRRARCATRTAPRSTGAAARSPRTRLQDAAAQRRRHALPLPLTARDRGVPARHGHDRRSPPDGWSDSRGNLAATRRRSRS